MIELALVAHKLLMFKVCGIIGISKIKFFDFSETQRVNNFVLDEVVTLSKRVLLYYDKVIL